MNLYLLKNNDGEVWYICAKTFIDAIQAWKKNVADVEKEESDESEEPCSIEIVENEFGLLIDKEELNATMVRKKQ